MMERLSALGDTALLAPASLALLIYLAVIRRWAETRAFAVALAFGLGLTFVAKLLFKACGGFIDIMDLNSPSGHASFATLFYGSLALMLGRGRSQMTGLVLGAAASLILLAVGFSRPAQGHHSWAEVVLGWAIGAAGIGVYLSLRPSAEDRPLSPVPLVVGFALAILLLGGRHFTPERHIGRLARAASATLDICHAPSLTAATPRVPTILP